MDTSAASNLVTALGEQSRQNIFLKQQSKENVAANLGQLSSGMDKVAAYKKEENHKAAMNEYATSIGIPVGDAVRKDPQTMMLAIQKRQSELSAQGDFDFKKQLAEIGHKYNLTEAGAAATATGLRDQNTQAATAAENKLDRDTRTTSAGLDRAAAATNLATELKGRSSAADKLASAEAQREKDARDAARGVDATTGKQLGELVAPYPEYTAEDVKKMSGWLTPRGVSFPDPTMHPATQDKVNARAGTGNYGAAAIRSASEIMNKSETAAAATTRASKPGQITTSQQPIGPQMGKLLGLDPTTPMAAARLYVQSKGGAKGAKAMLKDAYPTAVINYFTHVRPDPQALAWMGWALEQDPFSMEPGPFQRMKQYMAEIDNYLGLSGQEPAPGAAPGAAPPAPGAAPAAPAAPPPASGQPAAAQPGLPVLEPSAAPAQSASVTLFNKLTPAQQEQWLQTASPQARAAVGR